jgi:valyl-tRNA synthetase
MGPSSLLRRIMPEEILEKVYNPEKVEERWISFWERADLFHAASHSDRPSFSMVIPPPNVTGSLHVGHALNNTLQDILARWKRMCGFNVLWVPGMDHAGIATQNVVERQLAKEGTDRRSLGREAFIKKVWEWKETSGGTILKQLKRLGASCDWDRARFTMDEGLSRAVGEVFVRLYDEGLIYRAERLINWCPRCQTALSDIEVEYEEVPGKMYDIRYPVLNREDDEPEYLIVATTRPETLLGDTAVAVHPEDPRYNRFIGRKVSLPLTQRTIPIIGDAILVDREFGTGAVKITPGHDFNDEAAGKRHRLPIISLLDAEGRLSQAALSEKAEAEASLIPELSGKGAIDARRLVVQRLEEKGLLIKTEDHRHAIGKCYRCKTVIEPFQSPQWFVKVNDPDHPLAGPAIDAVRQKKIRLIPESWEANYFGWMENIQDWCISRQIWWGHRIPVWYCGNPECKEPDRPIVATAAPEKCPSCGSTDLRQDPDVLDTWFSSALWPFSTLGWPPELQADPKERAEAEQLLKTFYPTSTLVSGFDILFFWVARMAMMGLHFMKEVPFRDVYIHALVRDAEGQKMSKSKGNVIDPLEIMSRYGTDALRFTLASMASPGRDIKLAEDRIEGYRNFANKLWNAARFALMNLPEDFKGINLPPDDDQLSAADQWIKIRFQRTTVSVDEALKNYRFDEAAALLYRFIWHEFCDWYLEFIKVDLQEKSDAQKQGTYYTLTTTFEQILRLLHPFMPFITEELWCYFPHEGKSLTVAPYPKSDQEYSIENDAFENIMQEILIDTIVGIRNLRGEMNIPPSEELRVTISVRNQNGDELVRKYLPYIKRLARVSLEDIGQNLKQPKTAATVSTEWFKIYVSLDEKHVKKEIERLEKAIAKVEKEFEGVNKKFMDPKFNLNAPKDVVNKNEVQRSELSEKIYKLNADLHLFRTRLSEQKDSS